MPDESILNFTTAIASGDTEAFASLYEKWFDRMYREARRATGRDEAFCLDVVQEAMMRVIRAIKPIETEAALNAWLRAVVHSCCYDALRTERRRSRREQAIRSAESASGDARRAERLDWLRVQLANLEPEQARLLTLRFRFGWTLQRIAATLGLKAGAVDGRIARSIAGLQQQAREDLHE